MTKFSDRCWSKCRKVIKIQRFIRSAMAAKRRLVQAVFPRWDKIETRYHQWDQIARFSFLGVHGSSPSSSDWCYKLGGSNETIWSRSECWFYSCRLNSGIRPWEKACSNPKPSCVTPSPETLIPDLKCPNPQPQTLIR